MNIYRAPSFDSDKLNVALDDYIEEVLNRVHSDCELFFEADPQTLCFDRTPILAYQSILRDYKAQLSGLPILKVYYDICCTGLGQNFRFFLIDDSKLPKVTIYKSTAVVDRIHLVPYSVNTSIFAETTLDI